MVCYLWRVFFIKKCTYTYFFDFLRDWLGNRFIHCIYENFEVWKGSHFFSFKSEKSFKYLCASWLSFDFYEPLACVLLFSLHIPLTYVNNRWSHHRRLASLYQSLGLAVGEGSLNQFLTFSLFVVLIAEHIFYCNHWKFIGWLVNTLISTNGKIILGFQTLECLFWSLKCCY